MTTSMWLYSGLGAGALALLCAFYIVKRAKSQGRKVEPILTMERVITLSGDYLKKHEDSDCIAVSWYGPDNLPDVLRKSIKGKLPKRVQHILMLTAVKNDNPTAVVAVLLGCELEAALQHKLVNDIFKIER